MNNRDRILSEFNSLHNLDKNIETPNKPTQYKDVGDNLLFNPDQSTDGLVEAIRTCVFKSNEQKEEQMQNETNANQNNKLKLQQNKTIAKEKPATDNKLHDAETNTKQNENNNTKQLQNDASATDKVKSQFREKVTFMLYDRDLNKLAELQKLINSPEPEFKTLSISDKCSIVLEVAMNVNSEYADYVELALAIAKQYTNDLNADMFTKYLIACDKMKQRVAYQNKKEKWIELGQLLLVREINKGATITNTQDTVTLATTPTKDGKLILFEYIKQMGSDADKYLITSPKKNQHQWTELAKILCCDKPLPAYYNDENKYKMTIIKFAARYGANTTQRLLLTQESRRGIGIGKTAQLMNRGR